LQRQETGEDLNEYEVLCQTRMKKVVKEGESKWLNNSFDLKQKAYCENFKEVKGTDSDPYK
jgi:hypothetical protein